MAEALNQEKSKPLMVWVKLFGGLLGLLGVLFVGFKLVEYYDQLAAYDFEPSFFVSIGILATIYGVSNILLGLGWHRLLLTVGSDPDPKPVLNIYASSQLAKYVPGNVFQFLGRHALGLSLGLKNNVLAKAAFYELAMLGIGGALIAVLAAGYLFPGAPSMLWLIAALGLAVCFFVLIAKRLGAAASKSFLYYVGFLVLSGLNFLAMFMVLSGGQFTFPVASYVVGAFVLAWLLGLVTPGAPAGLGVRESILTILLAQLAPVSLILIAVLASRLVTVLGDLLFFVFGQYFFKAEPEVGSVA